MPTPRRRYTAAELNQLLNETRLPTFDHHPCIGLLVSMALVIENMYAVAEADAEWIDEVAPVLQAQLLAGLAAVLEHGVCASAPEAVQ